MDVDVSVTHAAPAQPDEKPLAKVQVDVEASSVTADESLSARTPQHSASKMVDMAEDGEQSPAPTVPANITSKASSSLLPIPQQPPSAMLGESSGSDEDGETLSHQGSMASELSEADRLSLFPAEMPEFQASKGECGAAAAEGVYSFKAYSVSDGVQAGIFPPAPKAGQKAVEGEPPAVAGAAAVPVAASPGSGTPPAAGEEVEKAPAPASVESPRAVSEDGFADFATADAVPAEPLPGGGASLAAPAPEGLGAVEESDDDDFGTFEDASAAPVVAVTAPPPVAAAVAPAPASTNILSLHGSGFLAAVRAILENVTPAEVFAASKAAAKGKAPAKPSPKVPSLLELQDRFRHQLPPREMAPRGMLTPATTTVTGTHC